MLLRLELLQVMRVMRLLLLRRRLLGGMRRKLVWAGVGCGRRGRRRGREGEVVIKGRRPLMLLMLMLLLPGRCKVLGWREVGIELGLEAVRRVMGRVGGRVVAGADERRRHRGGERRIAPVADALAKRERGERAGRWEHAPFAPVHLGRHDRAHHLRAKPPGLLGPVGRGVPVRERRVASQPASVAAAHHHRRLVHSRRAEGMVRRGMERWRRLSVVM